MTTLSGQEFEAPAPASDPIGEPLQRRETQASDYTEDPPSPADQSLILPQLSYTSSSQIWWDHSMCEALRLPSGYRKAAALLVKWDTAIDDFSERGQDEVNSLKTVLEQSFNYETVTVALSHDHRRPPEVFLKDQVVKFASKYNNPNDLLIVYYSGHASVPPDGLRLDLHPKRRGRPCPKGRHDPRLSWNIVEEVLMEEAKGDVLIILDACCAGNLKKAIAQRNLGRAYEFLGACGENKPTAAPGPYSFTSLLIKCLSELIARGPFTTSELLSHLQRKEERRHQPPTHWRRATDTLRHIQLARLPESSERDRLTAAEVDRYFGEDVPKYINLRIELKSDEPPTEEQIREFARSISLTVKNASVRTGLPTRRVDWMGFESRAPRKSWQSVIKSVTQAIGVAKRFRAVSLDNKMTNNEVHTQIEEPNSVEDPKETPSRRQSPTEELTVTGKRRRGSDSTNDDSNAPAKRSASGAGIDRLDFAAGQQPRTPRSGTDSES